MEFHYPDWQVENFLADFLDDNFSTYAEDNSPAEVKNSNVESIPPIVGARLLAVKLTAEVSKVLLFHCSHSPMLPASLPSFVTNNHTPRRFRVPV